MSVCACVRARAEKQKSEKDRKTVALSVVDVVAALPFAWFFPKNVPRVTYTRIDVTNEKWNLQTNYVFFSVYHSYFHKSFDFIAHTFPHSDFSEMINGNQKYFERRRRRKKNSLDPTSATSSAYTRIGHTIYKKTRERAHTSAHETDTLVHDIR